MLRTLQTGLRPVWRTGGFQVGGKGIIPSATRQHLAAQKRPSSSFQALQSWKMTNRFIWAMITVNVTVFGAWNYFGKKGDRKALQALSENAAVSWANIHAGRYWTVITSTFSHISGWHLFFNMFGLWTFGGLLARCGVGLGRVAALYLGGGLASSAACLYEYREVAKPVTGWQSYMSKGGRQQTRLTIGASGVVMALVGAAACLAPMAPMVFIVFPAPLWTFAILYAGTDYFYLGREESVVSHSAHLGGMAFGILFYATSLRKFGGILNFARRLR